MSYIWSLLKPWVETTDGMYAEKPRESTSVLERVVSPTPEGVRKFVCAECDVLIDNGRSVLFLWDRTFCSGACRRNHLDTKAPPDMNAQYYALPPSAWERRYARHDQCESSGRERTTKGGTAFASFG